MYRFWNCSQLKLWAISKSIQITLAIIRLYSKFWTIITTNISWCNKSKQLAIRLQFVLQFSTLFYQLKFYIDMIFKFTGVTVFRTDLQVDSADMCTCACCGRFWRNAARWIQVEPQSYNARTTSKVIKWFQGKILL